MDLQFGNELPDYDVLIVGAGLSGLTSAVKILAKENSLHMKILDENSAPGGQLGTQGVRFVNAEQTELLSFLHQMNVTLRQRTESAGLQLRSCRELDRGLLAKPIKFELGRYIQMLDYRMKKFSSLRFPLRKRSVTMERHICSNLFFRRSRQFMFKLVELCSGLPPTKIKYDEFMCLCSCCGGLQVLIDLYFERPKSLMDLSCKQLLDSLLERLQPIEILLNAKVDTVEHFKDYVRLTTADGTTFTTHTVILAVPWDSVKELLFEPPLPVQFEKVSTQKPETKTLFTQFNIRYTRSFWVYQGYSGDFSNVEPFMVGFEHQPAEYSGYILHTEDELLTVRDTVLDLLAEPFGDEMRYPLAYNQQTKVLNRALIKPQTKPWLRVIWSGSSAVATRNRNLMGGAVESGIRSAVNALYVVRPQVVSWRDLSTVQDKKLYEGIGFSRVFALLSRLNLYNFTFYSVFVIGLIVLLNFGYGHAAGT
ncbi:hypothetical protein KR044_012636 [Drosophila immigrans]|nr:hypothetical protein KR044_012636 [Drosophila immigrans]